MTDVISLVLMMPPGSRTMDGSPNAPDDRDWLKDS